MKKDPSSALNLLLPPILVAGTASLFVACTISGAHRGDALFASAFGGLVVTFLASVGHAAAMSYVFESGVDARSLKSVGISAASGVIAAMLLAALFGMVAGRLSFLDWVFSLSFGALTGCVTGLAVRLVMMRKTA